MDKKIIDELKELKQFIGFQNQTMSQLLTEIKGIRRELETWQR